MGRGPPIPMNMGTRMTRMLRHAHIRRSFFGSHLREVEPRCLKPTNEAAERKLASQARLHLHLPEVETLILGAGRRYRVRLRITVRLPLLSSLPTRANQVG